MGLFGGIGKAIGSAVSSIGSIGGQFGDIGGSLSLADQYVSPGKQLKNTVKAARDVGISPLVALKANLGGTTIPTGGLSLSGHADGSGATPEGQQFGPGFDELLIGKQMEEIESRSAMYDAEAELARAKAAKLGQTPQTTAAALAQQSYMPGQIEAVPLDPSHITDRNGRLRSWRDFAGNWHRTDVHTVPQEVLEQEYGEAAELHGVGRVGYKSGGIMDWPTMEEIVNYLRR